MCEQSSFHVWICLIYQFPVFLLLLVDHSQSVPTSPSIHRAAESSPPPVTSLQQQFSNSYCRTAPPTTGGASNFSFDNIVPPTCDISTGNVTLLLICIIDILFGIGTSQEEREEREKNEAFSRLHQGNDKWIKY